MHEERQSQESKQRMREKRAASFLRGGPEAWLGLMGSFDILFDSSLYAWDCFLEFIFFTLKHDSSLLVS